MLKITDGRDRLYQWDTNRTLTVVDMPNLSHVDFEQVGCEPCTVLPVEDMVSIPNIMLQNPYSIVCYMVSVDRNGTMTKSKQTFLVEYRSKPSDYCYTETDTYTWEQFAEKQDAKLSDALLNAKTEFDVLAEKTEIAANQSASDAQAAAKAKADAEDAASYARESAEAAANELSSIKGDLNDISEILESKNIYNPADAVNGTLSTTNTINKSTYITTGFIKVNEGDILFAGYVGTDGIFKPNSNMFLVAAHYDSDKNFISRTNVLYSHSYTIPSGVSYIRATFQITYSLYKDSITVQKNDDVTEFVEYFSKYKIAKDDVARDGMKKLSGNNFVDKTIIDCWGDSRTEMIYSDGTSYPDYLKNLLGGNYHVCNYGESSQASGMVTARLGSNELFMTLENNKIASSGVTLLTAIKCSSGNNRNLFEYRERYIYGRLNGVLGRFSRTTIESFTGTKFERINDGIDVTVTPGTKFVVEDVGSKKHINILWFGKNDFGVAGDYVVSGIIENYEKAVKYLGHDYYVILGETCSLNESYETGGDNRAKLDEINSTLAEKYSDNYIDINSYLSSEQALDDVGLVTTDTDLEYIGKGFPCYQLMVYSTDNSDTVHPNAYGRKAIAHKIYEFMVAKGWVNA